MTQLSPQDQDTLNALMLESLKGKDIQTFQLCVEKGADVHDEIAVLVTALGDRGSTSRYVSAPLYHFLLQAGQWNRDVSDFLLQKGVSIDARNEEGSTPLMLAIGLWEPKLAAYFIEKGASLHAVNKKGESVLALAQQMPQARTERKEILSLLLNALPSAQEQASAPAATDKPIAIMKPIVVKKKPATGGFKL